jgi:putative heme uptake system protein
VGTGGARRLLPQCVGRHPDVVRAGAEEKVVDIAIQRTLQALADRPDDVMLVSHDGDFLDDLGALVGDGRRVGVVGFSEFRNAGFAALAGIERFDLEYDARAFDAPLPRIRVIPIEEFDPRSFLD